MQPLIEISRPGGVLPYGYALEDQAPQGFSFTTVFGAVRRRKQLITVTFVVVMATVIGLLHILPPQFTATASVIVEQADTRMLAGKPVARSLPEWMPGDNSTMATQINILTARALAAQVVAKLALAEDPEFRSTIGRLKEQMVNLAQRWFPTLWRDLIPWTVEVDLQAAREREAVQHFQRQLSVQQQGTSHVVSISIPSIDPNKAERITNAVAKQYLDNQIEAKYRATDRAYAWTTEQVHAQRLQLLAAENATVDYMAEHGLLATNGLPEPSQPPPYKASLGGLPAQQLTSLQDDLATARAQLAAKQARLQEIDALSARNLGYDSLPEVASSPVIMELTKQDAALRATEARLGNTYNDRTKIERQSISQRIARETANIVQNIRNDEALERFRNDKLDLLMSKGWDQYASSERASVQLRELTRDASAKRALYEASLARRHEISEQKALVEPDGRILSMAVVPTRPDFPNKLMFSGVGFFGALTLGMVLAGLAEYNDNSLRTGQQAERTLGLTSLGLVPLLARGSRNRVRTGRSHTPTFRQLQLNYSEMMRSILMQLVDKERYGQAQVMLITSALPGEGKTTTGMCLGATAARLGRRTVVVDLDLRHPNVAHQAALSVEVDLVDYMAGKVGLDRIIHVDPEDANLHFIPLRTSAQSSADMLHFWNLRRLVDDLRGRYEFIVLDLPPSLALSDVQLAGRLADTAILVVQWGKTSRLAARNAIVAMARIGISITGVVLTQVDLRRHALYGYEQFGEYHKKYLEYFRQFGGTA